MLWKMLLVNAWIMFLYEQSFAFFFEMILFHNTCIKSFIDNVYDPYWVTMPLWVNTLRPKQNKYHLADIFKCIFLNENVLISIKISLKFIPKGPINNILTLVQIMAWHWLGRQAITWTNDDYITDAYMRPLGSISENGIWISYCCAGKVNP